MKFQLTPPTRFLVVGFAIVLAIIVGTTVTQYRFYRQQIIEHESNLIAELVSASVVEHAKEGVLALSDLTNYGSPVAQMHLADSFDQLERLSGAARLKVFNQYGEIAWSDARGLIGTRFTRNWADRDRALQGEVRAVFIAKAKQLLPEEALPEAELIEFYVPIVLSGEKPSTGNVAGVLAIYRSSDKINAVISQGLYLLWLVTGIGGLVLFAALYALFRSVYFGKKAAETRFAQLSVEHGRMMQLEKMSAMGQLVSEIAHQLNNPLVGVLNLTQLAEREADDRARLMVLLAKIRTAGQNCRDYVQRILAMSRVGKSEPQRIDLCDVARETIAFFVQSLGGRPPIELHCEVDRAASRADPVLLRNALFNLIHNAAQADPGGQIRVSIAPQQRHGIEGWSISVADSGPGIATQVMTQLFQPFFTTRQGGTGLGLAIARHIAIQHEGALDAANRPEGGALFTMWLPSSE